MNESDVEKKLDRLGSNIKATRLKLKMTQQDLADRADVHRNYISNLENGKQNPTIAVLMAISDVLNVKIDDLIHNQT